MAVKCRYCETELPGDNARFCNNCGIPVPFHPFSPQSLSTSKSNPDSPLSSLPTEQQEDSRPALREQAAFLPPARPTTRRPAPVTLPVWPDSQRLDPARLKKSLSGYKDAGRVENKSGFQDKKLQEKLPETPKVEMLPTSPLALSTSEQVAQKHLGEDMPTRPISISSAEQQNARNASVTSIAPGNSPRREGIEHQDTIPLLKIEYLLRRRFPFLITAILLFVLIVGAIGSWIVLYQPFSVAPITQPQLSFSNTNLGIALSYPNGWTKQIGVDRSTVQFYASNHTAEVDINVATVGGSDINQVLQQKSKKFDMRGAKAAMPLTFAGQTWQQLQGNLQQSGANYTVTILATARGNHLFTIVELAPQSNYIDWESQFFSPMHKTLRFL